MTKDSSQPRQLTPGPSVHGWPRWSPDGKNLACWAYDDKSGVSAIRVCSFDGGQPITLVESNESLDRPAWRPEGKHISYAAQTKGNWDIWTVAVE